jgi:hypothetical protein
LHHGATLPPDNSVDCSFIALLEICSLYESLHSFFPHHLLPHVTLVLCFRKVRWLYEGNNCKGLTDGCHVLWICKCFVDVFFEYPNRLEELLFLVRVFSVTLENVPVHAVGISFKNWCRRMVTVRGVLVVASGAVPGTASSPAAFVGSSSGLRTRALRGRVVIWLRLTHRRGLGCAAHVRPWIRPLPVPWPDS